MNNSKIQDFDLHSYLASKRKQINDVLSDILSDASDSGRIVHAMKYSLMAGGKRIRPILCMAAAEAVGGKSENVLKLACALEMIHTYSLIHDDLPAMDNDDLRRGKPTCHIAFDEATAILAGDALLTMAFQFLSSGQFTHKGNTSRWLAVMHDISIAAGYKGMIGGQMRDISSEGSRLTLDELQDMHALKTGALIEASISSGAILEGGSSKQIEKLRIYGKNIGLAFQVTDDILNIEGERDVLGKSVGTDKAHNKNTYPSIIGIEKSKEFAKEIVKNALQALNYFDNRSDPLRAIASYIIERKR